MLKPDLQVADITELTPELLQRLGADAVMVDLDDTIVPSGCEHMAARVKEWSAALQAGGVKLIILSNGTKERVERWAAELGIPGLHMSGKPLRGAFRRGLALLGSEPSRTVMVGDQLFTDVLGARLMGVRSVLVSPLSPGKLLHTRLLRKLERFILRRNNGQPVDR